MGTYVEDRHVIFYSKVFEVKNIGKNRNLLEKLIHYILGFTIYYSMNHTPKL